MEDDLAAAGVESVQVQHQVQVQESVLDLCGLEANMSSEVLTHIGTRPLRMDPIWDLV